MKSFFIKFWSVMMYSSFTMAGIFLLILLPSLGSSSEIKYGQSGGIPWYQSIEMIVAEIFNYLNIPFQPTYLQIFIVLFPLCLILGFISRARLIKLEYSKYSK